MGEPNINRPGMAQHATVLRESLGRILVLKIVLLLCFGIVALRLVEIQVIKAPHYREIARKQYEDREPLLASRGTISDRNGRVLVSNTIGVAFAADPKRVGERGEGIAEQFARVFNRPEQYYLSRLSGGSSRFVYLERRVDLKTSKRIGAGEREGVIALREPRRLYNYGHVAGQLIGFTDIDNNGLSGIELQLDKELRGADGYIIMQRDNQGRTRPSVDYPRVEPTNGNSLILTIDIDYQAIAEEELRKGVERNKADGGLVVMLDPETGEVLAMASNPPMDPGEASTTSPAQMRNRPVTDMFEPGSVFKVVTAAAALEHHLVRPEQKFFAENGSYVVGMPGGKPRTITDMHKFGVLTFQEALEQSSNIVFAKVSDIIGVETLYTTARDFGFGTATGIEVPGEVDGDLKKPSEWSGATLNSLAFGYEVGVTPLQLASAYAAVANGGLLMKPFIVSEVLDDHGTVITKSTPQVVRRVIPTQTARLLTQLLEGVVERGTGTLAKINGLAIAGKTGTSRRFFEGKYEPGNFTASFVGYFPADDPKLLCLVMLENPREGGYTGGLASAPIFKAIAQKVYQSSGRFGRRPGSVLAGSTLKTVPDVRNLKQDVARNLMTSEGFDVALKGQGAVVLGQSPEPGDKVATGSLVTLRTADTVPSLANGCTIVPDVRRYTIRRAINRLAMQQLGASVAGSGTVVAQSPPPGQQVKIGARIALRCEQKADVFAGLK